MEMPEKSSNTKKIAIIGLLFIVLVCALAFVYVYTVQNQYRMQIKQMVNDQQARLAATAVLTDTDKAPSDIEASLKDCDVADREQFDDLLGRLSKLDHSELQDTKKLFNACGSYFSEKRALTVVRLKHEYDVYVSYLQLLHTIDSHGNTNAYHEQNWKQLIDLESERSQLSTKLVTIQGNIIDALLTGESTSSDKITKMLKDAQNTKDSLIYMNTKINTMRSSILKV